MTANSFLNTSCLTISDDPPPFLFVSFMQCWWGLWMGWMCGIVGQFEVMASEQPRRQLLEMEESSQSEMTNYADDPHIFNTLWEYIFSIVGLTVGFGSFWRFPFLIYKNGGGIFLIPYLISMVVVGIPLLYLETAVGQMHRASIPFILSRIHPALKWLGIAMLTASLHLSSVYNILLTYAYRFVFSSLNPDLPFAKEEITQNYYFQQTVLHQSPSISEFEAINPSLFFIYVGSLLICHYIIKNGVKTSGKIVALTATSPFAFLLILLVRGLFLDGASEGLAYLFEPKWDKLWTSQIWIDAMVQVFYQLSVGLGTIYSIASMKPRREDFLKSVLVVPASILLCGLLSSMTVFVYLSHFCLREGLTIDDPSIRLSGPELSFNVFPKALSVLPFPNLFLFIFFIAMVFLGIDSEFGLIEAMYCYLKDEFKRGPVVIMGLQLKLETSKYILLGVIMLGCPTLTSNAGVHYLEFYDYFISNIPFTLWALAETYIFVHLFKFEELEKTIVKYTGSSTPRIIRFFLESPLLLFLLASNLLFAIYNQLFMFQKYPWEFYLLGWGITCYPIVLAYISFRRNWTCWEDLRLTFHALQHRPSYL